MTTTTSIILFTTTRTKLDIYYGPGEHSSATLFAHLRVAAPAQIVEHEFGL